MLGCFLANTDAHIGNTQTDTHTDSEAPHHHREKIEIEGRRAQLSSRGLVNNSLGGEREAQRVHSIVEAGIMLYSLISLPVMSRTLYACKHADVCWWI